MRRSLRISLVVAAVAASLGAAAIGRAQASSSATIAQPSGFVPVDSYRSFDSRDAEWGNKLSVEGVQSMHPGFDLSDGSGNNIPTNAVAVAYNLTVTDTQGAGFLAIDTLPMTDNATSDINWTGPIQTVANGGITSVKIGDDGTPTLGLLVGGTNDARAHVIVDINGYFVEP